MINKLKNVPSDSDTAIITQYESTLSGFDVLHQSWVWEGIARKASLS